MGVEALAACSPAWPPHIDARSAFVCDDALVSCPADRVAISEEVASTVCGTISGVVFSHLRAAGGTKALGAIEKLAGRGCVSSAVNTGAGGWHDVRGDQEVSAYDSAHDSAVETTLRRVWNGRFGSAA